MKTQSPRTILSNCPGSFLVTTEFYWYFYEATCYAMVDNTSFIHNDDEVRDGPA